MTPHPQTTTGSFGHAARPGRAAADGRVSARGRPRPASSQDATAVVLDTDGGITDSARIHAGAWKTAFDACLRTHPPTSPGAERPFDVQDDYLQFVDGKAWLDGAASFLWDAYRARYGDIRRLDRILEAEGDTVNRYRASKQADVLMLGYLFSPTELRQVFARLGYELDDALWTRTVDYCLQRTSHGSTLSGLVHGWVLARARRADAWTYVEEVLAGDVADVQGGTTQEGIHLGAMAGTLDLVQRGLTGLETRNGAL